MDLDLRGKRAIVLGGTRGIGRAIADTLADEGCDVAVCARNAVQVEEAVAALKARGVNAVGGTVDIADGEGLKSWVESVGKDLGGLDVLVSNASALTMGAGPEEWRKMLDVDVLGAVNAIEGALPFLEASAAKTGDAAIVAISSVSSVNSAEPAAYGAMKAALVHYMRGVAKKNAPKHIRANVVSPGTVYFEGGVWHVIEKNMPDYFKTMIERNPTGRMGTPQDIADAAVFLASPRSSFTTGVNMVVDGAITDRVNF